MRYRAGSVYVFGEVFLCPGENLATRTEKAGNRKPKEDQEFKVGSQKCFHNQNTNIIFGDLNTNNNKLNINSTEPLCILIGPEGDFTTQEREKILKLKNIIPLKINENILRSETAAISIISIVTFNLLS